MIAISECTPHRTNATTVSPRRRSDPALRHQLGEVLERAVPGPLGIDREAARRELTRSEVVADAVAARPLALARLVRTAAKLEIVFLPALHGAPPTTSGYLQAGLAQSSATRVRWRISPRRVVDTMRQPTGPPIVSELETPTLRSDMAITMIATIFTTMLTIAPCGCADRPQGHNEPRLSEEGAMSHDSDNEKPVVDIERSALEQFGRGDIDGPLELCDEEISYFDPFVERRIDDRTALGTHYEKARGTPQYDRAELVGPRVQAFGDTAILTYVLVTSASPDIGSAPTRWKVTTVYHRRDDRWRVVHSHFALFADSAPRDFEFTERPADLGQPEGTLLGELLGLEDTAMERWRRGDPWGFWELSAAGVSYFDPETDGRIDGADGLRALYTAVEGKVLYDVSEYIAPRVQRFGDVAVLSYQYRSADIREDGSVSSGTRWNTTEVFAKIDDRWRIVHTHWSYARAGALELDPSS